MQGDFINETDTSTRMTAPAITGGAEGKLQRLQWQPGQPPRRRIRFYYCTIIMIIEWHNTRFSHIDWHIYASMNYVNIDLDNGVMDCSYIVLWAWWTHPPLTQYIMGSATSQNISLTVCLINGFVSSHMPCEIIHGTLTMVDSASRLLVAWCIVCSTVMCNLRSAQWLQMA